VTWISGNGGNFASPEKDARWCEPGDCNRADHMGNEGPEIAARTARLLDDRAVFVLVGVAQGDEPRSEKLTKSITRADQSRYGISCITRDCTG
jgi:hypothetical protein